MNPLQFAISFLVGTAAGILSGLGIGGGTLMVLYLTLVAKIPQVQAQGINLIYFLCACVPAAVMHIKEKRADVKTTCTLSLVGMIAAVFGAVAVTENMISVSFIRRIFGIIVIYTAMLQLVKSMRTAGYLKGSTSSNRGNSEE